MTSCVYSLQNVNRSNEFVRRNWRCDIDMTEGDNYDTSHNILCRSDSHTESTVSDSDSSVAPTDFQLSESFECSTQSAAVSVALEHCWLCLGSRRSFYCKQCVRTGDFVHSHLLQQPFQPLRPPIELERWVKSVQKVWTNVLLLTHSWPHSGYPDEEISILRW